MKLFLEQLSCKNSQNRFKFKGNYTFRVLNDSSKGNETTTTTSNFSYQNSNPNREYENCVLPNSSSSLKNSNPKYLDSTSMANTLIHSNNINHHRFH